MSERCFQLMHNGTSFILGDLDKGSCARSHVPDSAAHDRMPQFSPEGQTMEPSTFRSLSTIP